MEEKKTEQHLFNLSFDPFDHVDKAASLQPQLLPI
jgi:hypothetical protein